jgi:hypothetical protein
MAPPRRKRVTTPGEYRDYKIRLPEDVAQRIEAKAKGEQRPQNRVIINELAAFPDLEEVGKLARHVGHIEVLLARYASQLTSHDLSDQLLAAVDAALKADGGALQAAVEKLRVVRAGMLAHERTTKRAGREPQ